MKRTLALILILCLCLGLCACGNAGGSGNHNEGGSNSEASLLVGFGRTDITPEDSVPLASYGDEATRLSTGYVENLYCNALAVTDAEGNSLIVVTGDLTWCPQKIGAEIRSQIVDRLGIPGDNVILTGTHNHSGPSASLSGGTLEQTRYTELYIRQMVEAAVAAWNDRLPARMYIGSANAEGLTFVRRYELLDGTYPNFETVSSDKIKGHESEADTMLRLLKFVRQDGKDILVYNWQAHANLVSHNKEYYMLASTDIFGPFRTEVESRLDVHCFVWNGAAGNLNPESQIDGETPTTDHKEYGMMLARYAVEASENAVLAEAGTVEVSTQIYAAEVNHTFDSVVDKAREISEYYKSTGDQETCRTMGAPYGINTRNHAARIIANSKLGPTQDVLMKVARIGNVGFIVLPYEMFDSDGMYIRDNSPYAMTFVIGYAENYSLGYIPSALAENHGGYEVDNSTFVMGTAQILAEQYVAMLKELAE